MNSDEMFSILARLGAAVTFADEPADLLSDATLRSAAAFSPDMRYRYALSRRWGPGSTVVFVMLNPSTADAFKVDPTVNRCLGFARAWGHEELVVLNLFALRSTDPKALYTAKHPVGGLNDSALALIPTEATVVCAWGVHGALNNRGAQVREMLTGWGRELHHLGLTRDGEPKHPLYLRKTLEPATWPEIVGTL